MSVFHDAVFMDVYYDCKCFHVGVFYHFVRTGDSFRMCGSFINLMTMPADLPMVKSLPKSLASILWNCLSMVDFWLRLLLSPWLLFSLFSSFWLLLSHTLFSVLVYHILYLKVSYPHQKIFYMIGLLLQFEHNQSHYTLVSHK